ncbi:MAG: hypothetical protein QOC75_1896, partial [Pseudonocardiales bacterium]|nr:hypothetical protein [Pseudonocardiales bacterium]
MTGNVNLGAAALRRLDEDLTQSVMLPPVDAVIRRASSMNRTTTAATAAVLTVGALGAVTVVAQSVVSGAVPLPAPVALSAAPPPALSTAPGGPVPAIAQVLSAGEQLVHLKPGVAAPAGSRSLASGVTVLAPGTRYRTEEADPVDLTDDDND